MPPREKELEKVEDNLQVVNSPQVNAPTEFKIRSHSELDAAADEVVALLKQYDETIKYAQTAIKHYYDLSVDYKKNIDSAKTQAKKRVYSKKLKKNNKELFAVLVKERQLIKLRDKLIDEEGVTFNDIKTDQSESEGSTPN